MGWFFKKPLGFSLRLLFPKSNRLLRNDFSLKDAHFHSIFEKKSKNSLHTAKVIIF